MNHKNGRFGVIESPESMLIYDGDIVCGSSESIKLPSKYMLPDDLIPKVRNQLTTNMCVAFALTGIMQILNKKETGDSDTFSPGFTYTQCRTHKGEGMFPETTVKLTMEKGCCKESEFPYIYEVPDILDTANKKITSDMKEAAKNYKIAGYVCYNSAVKSKKAESIKQALYTNQTPILLITDHYGMNHAVVIIGWDDNDRFVILNSWGEKWGKNGIGTVPYENVTTAYLLIDAKNVLDNIPFTDVGKSEWYYNAVKKCYFSGIIKGVSKTEFDPLRATTRAEMAQIIFNINNKQNNINYGKVSKFKDVESDAWYSNVVAYCISNGFMIGVSDTEFEPDRAMTRAEMAQIFYNMRDKTNIAITREFTHFNDVDKTEWYYNAVKYCYERELVNGVGEGLYLPEKEVTRAETAQFVYNYCKAIDRTNMTK